MIICIGFLFLFLTCANATYNTYNENVYKNDLDSVYVQWPYIKNVPNLHLRKREAILSTQNNPQEQNKNIVGSEKSELEVKSPVGLSEGVGLNVNPPSNSSVSEPAKAQQPQLTKLNNITETKVQNATNTLENSKSKYYCYIFFNFTENKSINNFPYQFAFMYIFLYFINMVLKAI